MDHGRHSLRVSLSVSGSEVSGGRTVAPALQSQPLRVGPRPIQRKPFLLEELRQHDVAVVKHLHFYRYSIRKKNAADISRAAAQTPQHACPGLNNIARHVWRQFPYFANENDGSILI